MKLHKHNFLVSAQVIAAVVAAFFGFGLVGRLIFAIYLTMNNGVYPPFMPGIVETTSLYVGGFVAAIISVLIMVRVKYKLQITFGVIACIFLAVLKLRYSEQPEISFYLLPYEILVGGVLFIVVYSALNKYVASNNLFKSTPKNGAI